MQTAVLLLMCCLWLATARFPKKDSHGTGYSDLLSALSDLLVVIFGIVIFFGVFTDFQKRGPWPSHLLQSSVLFAAFAAVVYSLPAIGNGLWEVSKALFTGDSGAATAGRDRVFIGCIFFYLGASTFINPAFDGNWFIEFLLRISDLGKVAGIYYLLLALFLRYATQVPDKEGRGRPIKYLCIGLVFLALSSFPFVSLIGWGRVLAHTFAVTCFLAIVLPLLYTKVIARTAIEFAAIVAARKRADYPTWPSDWESTLAGTFSFRLMCAILTLPTIACVFALLGGSMNAIVLMFIGAVTVRALVRTTFVIGVRRKRLCKHLAA